MAQELTVLKPLRGLMPFGDFETMRREMDRIMDSFAGAPRRFMEAEWIPSLDVKENKNEYIVKAEIPGMKMEDIDISFSDGLLSIKGEKNQEEKKEEENYHLIERSYGSFARFVQLPGEVDSDKIKAEYKDGILEVILPKSEKAKKKEIKIKVGGK